ncbi:MAG: conjugal transfer protein [Neisseriaceae bacterium]|nr:MAG: conjugal transfer protein [Neisseriaceae bacterium]
MLRRHFGKRIKKMSNERKTLMLKRPRVTDSSGVRRRKNTKVEVVVKKTQKNPFQKQAKKVKVKEQTPVSKELKKPRVQTPPQKKKGPSHPLPKIRMPVSEATENLQTYWPDIFSQGKVKPLQVGILNHLKADAKNRNLPLSGRMIKRCLSSLTYTVEYRLSIQSGQARYDKDGQICARIDEVDELDSKKTPIEDDEAAKNY